VLCIILPFFYRSVAVMSLTYQILLKSPLLTLLAGSAPTKVGRSLEIFSRTFRRFVIFKILLHAYIEYFSDIVVCSTYSGETTVLE